MVGLPADDAGVFMDGDIVSLCGLRDILHICPPFQGRLGQSSYVPSEDLGRVPGPRAASEVDRNVWVMDPAIRRLRLRRTTASPRSAGVVVVGWYWLMGLRRILYVDGALRGWGYEGLVAFGVSLPVGISGLGPRIRGVMFSLLNMHWPAQ